MLSATRVNEVSNAPESRPESDAGAIARATKRWLRFYASLSEIDKIVLDKAALGQKLKVVCFDHNVPYDTLQKRFKRWQEDLRLPSLNVLLYVWQVVRAQHPEDTSALADEVPTLMRYAPDVALEAAMQRRPGYKEVRLPESLSARAPGLDGFRSDSLRQRDIAEQMGECVMSPALWLALLTIGQQVGAMGLQRAVVPFQHQLFLQMLGAADSADVSSIAQLQFFEAIENDEASGSGQWGAGAPLALPIAITARAMGLLAGVAPGAAESELRRSSPLQQRAFWELRAARIDYVAYVTRNDIALWQRFCASIRDDSIVTQALHAVTLDIVLAPLTGMAVALVARSARFANIHGRFAAMYQVIVRARLRHAQQLGIHPRRLLAYFALEAAGIPAHPSMIQLSASEGIVTEVDITGRFNPRQSAELSGTTIAFRSSLRRFSWRGSPTFCRRSMRSKAAHQGVHRLTCLQERRRRSRAAKIFAKQSVVTVVFAIKAIDDIHKCTHQSRLKLAAALVFYTLQRIGD